MGCSHQRDGWPTVQTIHILAIAVWQAALTIDLPLLGVFWADRPLEDGSVAIFSPLSVLCSCFWPPRHHDHQEPARSLKNPAFHSDGAC